MSKQKKSPSCQAAKPGEHERTHTRLFAFKHLPSTGHDWVPTPEEVETGEAAAERLGIPRSHGYRSIPTFGSNNLTQ